MTEKRFTIGNVLTKCSGIRNNGNLMTFNEVVDLLNEQHEEINRLRLELDTHKHPLWSTRQAEAKVNELVDTISELIEKNSELYDEINKLRIENMRLKALKKVILND